MEEVCISLRDMPFQFGPWGEVLAQYKFLFVGSVVNLNSSQATEAHPAYDEPTVTVDWSLKLSAEAQANLFHRIRLHFDQSTCIVDDVKEKRKYRQSEEDLLMVRNVLALWDQIRDFCSPRLTSFTEMDRALRTNNHKDADLREIIEQRPFQFALSMLPCARAEALKQVKEQEQHATMEVDRQRLEVREARWKFFQTALAKDQAVLQQLKAAPAKLKALRHRKIMQWKHQEAEKGEKIVQNYMSTYLRCELVERMEHAQLQVNEFRALVVSSLHLPLPFSGGSLGRFGVGMFCSH